MRRPLSSISWLEADGRRVFGSMMAVYRAPARRNQAARRRRAGARVRLEPLAEDADRHAVVVVSLAAEMRRRHRVMSTPSAAPSTVPPPSVVIVGGGLAGASRCRSAGRSGLPCRSCSKHDGGSAGGPRSFVDPATGEVVDHCQHVSMGCCTNLADFCRRTGILPTCSVATDGCTSSDPTTVATRFAPAAWLPAPLHLARGFLGAEISHGARPAGYRPRAVEADAQPD